MPCPPTFDDYFGMLFIAMFFSSAITAWVVCWGMTERQMRADAVRNALESRSQSTDRPQQFHAAQRLNDARHYIAPQHHDDAHVFIPLGRVRVSDDASLFVPVTGRPFPNRRDEVVAVRPHGHQPATGLRCWVCGRDKTYGDHRQCGR